MDHTTKQITFTIELPELRSTPASKHHEYRIHGSDSLGEFDVWRRYSDFLILKQYMMNRWPGVYTPSIPEKKFIGNNQSLFLQFRREGLDKFLSLIKETDWLWYGDEFQLFIKSKSSEVDKFLSNLGKTNIRELSTKYRTKFDKIISLETNQETDLHKINEFRAFLKNSLTMMDKLAKVSEAMTEDRKKYTQKYEILLTNILPTYEEQCIKQYSHEDHKPWFANLKINGLGQCQANMEKVGVKNWTNIISELIKEEIRELNNFSEILKSKQDYESMRIKAISKKKDLEIEESKINMGKESLLNKIKKASKEEMLQQVRIQLNIANEQVKDIEEICLIINRLLASDQIGKFKEIRSKRYYEIVREMFKAKKDSLESEIEFWSKISGIDETDIDLKQFTQEAVVGVEEIKVQQRQKIQENMKTQTGEQSRETLQ